MKTTNLTRILATHLRLPSPLSLYELSRALHELFPDSAILESEDWDFNLLDYAERGCARVRLVPDTHAMKKVDWMGQETGLQTTPEIALFEVMVEEAVFHVLTVEYDDCAKRQWIIGPSEPAVRRFFADVCRTLGELADEILVWHYGACRRDANLFRAIRSASFEDLILANDLKRKLLEDFESFFSSEELYKKYRIAWRRGLIFIGPPGNGKTHAVKALVQHAAKPCLYVRSFKSRHGTEHGVYGAFNQARKMAPCVMVLEDVDSLVDQKTRSFFLYELDGFAGNRGILVVATTNHPEKLDPAIVDRPSRFDRKIAFDLPAREERLKFLSMRVQSWDGDLVPSGEELGAVADMAEGFSFAYLKELCTSSLMAWMQTREPGAMGKVMRELVGVLRTQMASEPHPVPEPVAEEDEDE